MGCLTMRSNADLFVFTPEQKRFWKRSPVKPAGRSSLHRHALRGVLGHAQGIDRSPIPYVGRAAWEMEQRGVPTRRALAGAAGASGGDGAVIRFNRFLQRAPDSYLLCA